MSFLLEMTEESTILEIESLSNTGQFVLGTLFEVKKCPNIDVQKEVVIVNRQNGKIVANFSCVTKPVFNITYVIHTFSTILNCK